MSCDSNNSDRKSAKNIKLIRKLKKRRSEDYEREEQLRHYQEEKAKLTRNILIASAVQGFSSTEQIAEKLAHEETQKSSHPTNGLTPSTYSHNTVRSWLSGSKTVHNDVSPLQIFQVLDVIVS